MNLYKQPDGPIGKRVMWQGVDDNVYTITKVDARCTNANHNWALCSKCVAKLHKVTVVREGTGEIFPNICVTRDNLL